MSEVAKSISRDLEKTMQSLAKEVAYDIFPLEDILRAHNVAPDEYNAISETQYFQRLLAEAVESWSSATNTTERTKLKIAALVEETLEDMHAMLVSPKTADTARVELFKTLLRSTGLSQPEAAAGVGAEKISITINMGDGREVALKDVSTPVIDYDGAEDA